jgi:hypothetical protein
MVDRCTSPADSHYPRLVLEPLLPTTVKFKPVAIAIPLCPECADSLSHGIACADLWP